MSTVIIVVHEQTNQIEPSTFAILLFWHFFRGSFFLYFTQIESEDVTISQGHFIQWDDDIPTPDDSVTFVQFIKEIDGMFGGNDRKLQIIVHCS